MGIVMSAFHWPDMGSFPGKDCLPRLDDISFLTLLIKTIPWARR